MPSTDSKEHRVTIADLSSATPAEIDTILAPLWQETARAEGHLARLQAEMQIARQRQSYLDALARYIATEEAKLTALRAEAAPYLAEYTARGGWNRYFLVTNMNGHVHREMTCSTCFPDTQYGWLPALSGCDESAMVEEWGERACTVCFPSAPTNPLYHRPAKIDQEAKAARAAEKAARDAAKAEKAITDVDGSPLRVGRDTLRTKIAARNALSEAVQNIGWYGVNHPSDFVGQVRKLVPALEAAGIETAPVIERAAKRVAKEGADHDALAILVVVR